MIKKLLFLFDVTQMPKVIFRHLGLLRQMTMRCLESRYRGSFLGLAWSFAHPLLMLCVYTFVFSTVLKARWGEAAVSGDGSFAVIMFCGLWLHNLLAESAMAGSVSVSGSPNMVKKVIFPLEILPTSQVLSVFILGIPWILLLFVGTLLVLGHVGWTMLLLPLVLLPFLLLALGVAYFVSSLGVFVNDVKYIVGIVMQILMFATPIFYPMSVVPEKFRWILAWNPLTLFVEQARAVFLYGRMPDWHSLWIATLVSFAVFQFGSFFFFRTKRGFADVL